MDIEDMNYGHCIFITGTNGANIFFKKRVSYFIRYYGTIQLMSVMPIYIYLFKCHFPANARIPLYVPFSWFAHMLSYVI
jgi:hypothetical protein